MNEGYILERAFTYKGFKLLIKVIKIYFNKMHVTSLWIAVI